MMISPKPHLTGTTREVEGEVDRQTHGDERLLLKLRAQVAPVIISKLWLWIGQIGTSSLKAKLFLICITQTST